VGETEQRILNHIDAVVANGPRSIWAVASGILLEEEGASFVATLLLGSLQGNKGLDLIRSVVSGSRAVNIGGIREALKHAPHPDVKHLLRDWVHVETREDLCAIGAEIGGYRHECDAHTLAELLRVDSDQIQMSVAGALRRCRIAQALPVVENLVDRTSAKLRGELLLSALCLGSYPGVERCRRLVSQDNNQDNQIIQLLGLCGSRSDLSSFLKSRSIGFDNAAAIRSAGVLGNAEAIPFLLKALQHDNEKLRVAAAEALELLTGASLRETVLIRGPDTGEGEEEVAGSNVEVERASTNHLTWTNWWQHNGTQFTYDVRWRKGVPLTFGILIETMLDRKSLYQDRYQAYLELTIRSGHDIPFEPDWFVAKQKKALSLWQSWWQSNQSKFYSGKWYFHGQMI
jgi:hypothetical protein